MELNLYRQIFYLCLIINQGMRIFIISFLLVVFSITTRSQTNIFAEKIYHATKGILCNSVLKINDSVYDIAGEGNIIRLDETGDIISAKIADQDIRIFLSMQTKESGIIYIGDIRNDSISDYGLLVIKTDSSGNILFSKEYNIGTDIAIKSAYVCSDSSVIICGYDNSYTISYLKIYYIKISKNGSLDHCKSFSTSARLFGTDIIQTSDSSVYILGEMSPSYGEINTILMRFENDTDLVWTEIIEVGQPWEDNSGCGLFIKNDTLYSCISASPNFIARVEPTGNIVCDLGFHVPWFGYVSPVKLHYDSNGKIFYIANGSNYSITYIADTMGVLSNDGYIIGKDIFKTNDGGFIIFGNGPLVYSKEEQVTYWDHIGIIKTDSLFNSVNCMGNSVRDTMSVPEPDIILTSYTLTENDVIVEIYDHVITFDTLVLITESGCVDATGNIQSIVLEQSPMIFPNPTSGNITIEFPYGTQIISEVRVIDILGNERFFKRDIDNVTLVINFGFLPSGVYVIEITNTNKEKFHRSIIIESN